LTNKAFIHKKKKKKKKEEKFDRKPSDVEGIFVIMHLIENLSLLGRDLSFYLKFIGIAFVNYSLALKVSLSFRIWFMESKIEDIC
jgi:hypothetical protein